MKITSIANVTIVGRPDPTEMNGKRYYKVSFLCNGEAGTMSCTEDVYNKVGPIKDGGFVPAIATLVYNDKYQSMSITGLTFPPSGTTAHAGK